RARFVALTGSTDAGNASLQKVKDTAKQSGIEFGTMERSIEAAAAGLNKGVWNPPILVDASKAVTKFTDGLTTAYGTIGKILQTSGATAADESKVFDALGKGIGATGTLTARTFDTIRAASLPLARAIASAFGYSSIA